jgi:hypothetical protein
VPYLRFHVGPMSEGVWLDQVPYEPPLKACVTCGDPLGWNEVMVKWIDGRVVTPLCRPCFDRIGAQ